MIFLICFIISVASYHLTKRFVHFCHDRSILMDAPCSRSAHRKPVVRGAGIIFVSLSIFSWSVIALLSGSIQLVAMSFGAALLALVSFLDDLYSLRIRSRLLAQVFVAGIFLATIPVPNFLFVACGMWSYIWYLFALFFMVAVINLYNFMDGVDGMVALQGVLVLFVWCFVAVSASPNSSESLLCAVAAAGIFGFLLHNWQPAKVFMGDVGSTFIGYTFACLAVIQAPGVLRSTNFYILVLLMMPILFDATLTLIVRILSKEHWYLPHQKHLFQRLVRSGYSHAAVSAAYGAITAHLGLVMYLVRNEIFTIRIFVLPLFVLPFIALYCWVRYSENAMGVEHRSKNYGVKEFPVKGSVVR